MDLSISCMNVRGIKGKRDMVGKILTETHILAVCETWLRDSDARQCDWISERVNTKITHSRRRGFGGVGIVVHPLVKYTKIAEAATEKYQCLTIRTIGRNITVVYISPAARKADEEAVREYILATPEGSSIVLGDFNARHRRWDTIDNERGKRLVRWADGKNWKIIAPESRTCVTPRGSSNPDLCLTKGNTINNIHVLQGEWSKWSDHIPFKIHVATSHTKNFKNFGNIRKRLRTHKWYQFKAMTTYERVFNELQQKIEQCSNGTALEIAYKEFKKLILHPWLDARLPVPGRYKSFWTKTLDNLSKARSKAYKKAKKFKTCSHWEQYRKLDREVKRLVNRNKKARLRKLAKQIGKESNSKAVELTGKILSGNLFTRNDTKAIDPKAFTAHMATSKETNYSPQIERFEVDEIFVRNVQLAIQKAESGKAEGVDELFVECFKLDPTRFADIITKFWRQCSHVHHVLEDWRTAILSPIYKKGDPSLPQNYRPIAVLSHARKMIDAAIANAIHEEYTFSPVQLGFEPTTSTETAMLRHIDECKKFQYTAILDLQAAYDSVPRDLLMEVVQGRINPNITKMVAMALQPLNIKTKNDPSNNISEIKTGVPQGSPLSPTLFNMFMDTYVETLITSMEARNRTYGKHWACCLYADDVKLQADGTNTMKLLMEYSERWAKNVGMKWSPKKCSILSSTAPPRCPITLESQAIQVTEKAAYLGVSATATGISANTNVDRVKSARNRLALLKKELPLQYGIPYKTRARILKALVLPVATYGVHFCPMTTDLTNEWERLEEELIRASLGWFSQSRTARLRKMLRFPSLQQLISLRLESLEVRLDKRGQQLPQNTEARLDKQRLRRFIESNNRGETLSKHRLEEIWTTGESGYQRKLPSRHRKVVVPPMFDNTNQDEQVRVVRWSAAYFRPSLKDSYLGMDHKLEKKSTS